MAIVLLVAGLLARGALLVWHIESSARPTALAGSPKPVTTIANRPLALAVVGGLVSSTVLSLFMVPAMFMILAPRRGREAENSGVQAG
jgi:hypothetical protein